MASKQPFNKRLVQAVSAGNAMGPHGPNLPELDAPLLQQLVGSVKLGPRILGPVPSGDRIKQTLDLVIVEDAAEVDAAL